MAYNPAIHHRRSIRLSGYDYTAPGWYFLTFCTHQRQYLLGEIRAGEMHLNDLGMAAQSYWQRLTQHFPHIKLDTFVVMPNHFHGIVVITAYPAPADRGRYARSP